MQLLPAFNITINIDRNPYRFVVTQLSCDRCFETFLVKRRTSEIFLKSNRPLWRNKGIKKRAPDFTIIKGDVRSPYALQLIIEEIMKKVEGK